MNADSVGEGLVSPPARADDIRPYGHDDNVWTDTVGGGALDAPRGGTVNARKKYGDFAECYEFAVLCFQNIE